jgi:hypothetical protein
LADVAWGQTATGITGLYNTGQKSTGGLISGGTQVQSSASAPTSTSGWYVDYSSKNGGHTSVTTYDGDAYAISSADIPGSYTDATSSAEWITAPDAATNSGDGDPNSGGDYLPGNGIGNGASSNEGLYAYTLAINITGTGAVGTKVTTPVVIDMTIAADDGYSVYVNPQGANTNPTGAPSSYTASASATDIQGEWSNTTNLELDNGTTGSNGNAVFYIGTNYITVLVDNTNSINSTSSSTALNPSGLLVFQTAAFDNGAEVMDNGSVVPEVTPWLPLLGAVALYGFFWVRRRFFVAARTVLPA